MERGCEREIFSMQFDSDPGISCRPTIAYKSIGFAVLRSSISPVFGHFISLQLIGCISSPATN